tara:strand:+ start:1600 stop:2547 length:948 start_codon:yes stop_codon:yes gene_type:complete
MKRKALIFGIKGLSLSKEESKLLRKNKPWGIILFSRNIKNLKQTQKLVGQIRRIAKDKKYPILIDQEGGRVSRIGNIANHRLYTQNYFGKLYSKNKPKFKKQYENYISEVCKILKEIGVNINTVPVLDLIEKKANKIIGDRSYSKDPRVVSSIGKFLLKLYKKKKIGTVTKHIPGHGSAKHDTHHRISSIKRPKLKLVKRDFKPFRLCHSHFAMTAHLIYTAYDSLNNATQSKIIINEVIRKHIGFKGILISDDISMKALKFGLIKNAIMALNAGCNLVLHCNGNIKEMKILVRTLPTIDKFTQKKTSQFYKFLG